MDWCKTYIAGAGEACAHIGALLFTAEANTMIKRQHSCTSLPRSWLPPSHQVQMQHSSESVGADADLSVPPSKKLCIMAPPTQINQLHVRLSKTDGKTVVLSHTEGFSNPYVPIYKLMGIPEPLTDLFDSDAMKLSFSELLEKSSYVYDNG